MSTARMGEKPWVVMPLYYYPLNDSTWKPLYDAYVMRRFLKLSSAPGLVLANCLTQYFRSP